MQSAGTTTPTSHRPWGSSTGSTWTACPATAWWTCGRCLSCPGGRGTTQSSPCCRSSEDSCSWRRTWNSVSLQRAPPTRRSVCKLLKYDLHVLQLTYCFQSCVTRVAVLVWCLVNSGAVIVLPSQNEFDINSFKFRIYFGQSENEE